MTILKTVIVAMVGAIASFYAAKYTKRLLEEKPLNERLDDAKRFAEGLREDVMIKASDISNTTKTKYSEVIDKLDELYGKKGA